MLRNRSGFAQILGVVRSVRPDAQSQGLAWGQRDARRTANVMTTDLLTKMAWSDRLLKIITENGILNDEPPGRVLVSIGLSVYDDFRWDWSYKTLVSPAAGIFPAILIPGSAFV